MTITDTATTDTDTATDLDVRFAAAARRLAETDPATLNRITDLARRLARHPDDEADAVARATVAMAAAPGLTTDAVVRRCLRSAELNRTRAGRVEIVCDPTDADDLAEIRATDDRATDLDREAATYGAAMAALPATHRAILTAITGDAMARHGAHLDKMAAAGATDPAPWCDAACQNLTGRAVIVRARLRPSVVAGAIGMTGRLAPSEWLTVRAAAARAAAVLFARIAGQTDPAAISARAYRAARYSTATTGGGTVLLPATGNGGRGVAFMGGGKASKASPRGERLAPVFPWQTYASPVAAAAVADVARMLSAVATFWPDLEWEGFRTLLSVGAPDRARSAAPLARGGYVAADAGMVGQTGPSAAYAVVPGVSAYGVAYGAGATQSLVSVEHAASKVARAAGRKADADATVYRVAALPCRRITGPEAAPECGCDLDTGHPLREVEREVKRSDGSTRRLASHWHHASTLTARAAADDRARRMAE